MKLFFYNVYGANQIEKGKMATVNFQSQFRKKQPLTVVFSTQTEDLHISDTVNVCHEHGN